MITRNVVSVGIVVATLAAACYSTTEQVVRAPTIEAKAKLNCSSEFEQSAIADVLSRPGLIEAVYDYDQKEQLGHNAVSHLKGATIMLRPDPGLSRPLLSRALQCRAAQESSVAVAKNDTDPLSIGNPSVQVLETDTGYAVVIQSQNDEAAREIARRSHNLWAHSVARSQSDNQIAKVSPQ